MRAATFRLLLETAMGLIRDHGQIPSVAEVAVRSKVSRATAYRYFQSRSALATAVIDASLGPVRAFASDKRSGRERVRELFERTFPRFKEFEPQLRAAAQLALEQQALERAGLLEEEPYRRGHRIRILEHALAPLEPELSPRRRDRLHKALSVVYGIEPYVILKDIWGLRDREVEKIAVWMADALIDAAIRDERAAPRRRGSDGVGMSEGGLSDKPATLARAGRAPAATSIIRSAHHKAAGLEPRAGAPTRPEEDPP